MGFNSRSLKLKGDEMKKILFAKNSPYTLLPQNSKLFIPGWYRDSKKFMDSPNRILGDDNRPLLGLKACIPFLDSMVTGYMAQVSQDIQVTIRDGFPFLQWPVEEHDILSARQGVGSELLPIPAGHYPIHFVWRNLFSFKLPKGYSALLTHPLNRHDLPFTTLSAIIDGDTPIHPGQYPFFLKEGFEGIIPKGTPMFQILPFKRESWIAQEQDSILQEIDILSIDRKTKLFGWYREKVWHKKEFNDDSKN
jgi:hypothetical protein